MRNGLRVGVALLMLSAATAAMANTTPGSAATSSPVESSAAVAAEAAAAQGLIDPLPPIEVSVTAPEPRYVAPTLRDRLGRIWAPVYLNGKGPFRLVLDTGASHSAVIASVAADLGLPLANAGTVMLHGVTGSAIVPFVSVKTLLVGDLEAHNQMLPIVPDALGGADGVLGMEDLEGKRIFIDFMHDKITISNSHGHRIEWGYETIPLVRAPNGLLMTTAYIGGIRVKAIIDTGSQASVANLALQNALRVRHAMRNLQPASIMGATDDVQMGENVPISAVEMGPIIIRTPYLTVSDLDIFERWNLTREPAMLIGIDTLGLLDSMVIDYRRLELNIKMRHN